MKHTLWTRREFAVTATLAPFGVSATLSALPAGSAIPIGIEMYSVRSALAKDPTGTVREVAKTGYQGLEFYGPYYEWTVEQAKEMKRLLDELKIRCFSTHNDSRNFSAEKIGHAIEVNKLLGSQYVVMASSHEGSTPDAWKAVAEILNKGSEKLEAAGLGAGYHNHQIEFRGEFGSRPMDILAKNTKPSVMLQLDVGTCLEAGADPVAWIISNPGRIRSMHCKEWSPEKDKGYSVLFGEGVAPWKQLFDAAEHGGGIEYYLIEQEGSRFSEIETAQRCLASFQATHGA